MKQILTYFIFLCLSYQPLFAQASPDDDGYFDPETDPVLITVNSKLRFAISEELFIRSADIRLGKLGMVESFDKKYMEKAWNIIIECRYDSNIEQSAMVALKLRSDSLGNYFAEPSWIACLGWPCGSCGLEENGACFCKGDKPGEPGVPGECNMVWSDEPLLKRVPFKKPD